MPWYSLQANTKTIEGKQHVDRDAQFGYLNDQATLFGTTGDPVISVDTKKKELIGNFTASGREWEPTGEPTRTNVHDFVDKELGKVAPYGVYDIAANAGWVNVGTDADTGQFAVQSIRRWWNTIGTDTYPTATRLMITADSGGSTAPGCGCGKPNSLRWPPRPGWRSPSPNRNTRSYPRPVNRPARTALSSSSASPRPGRQERRTTDPGTCDEHRHGVPHQRRAERSRASSTRSRTSALASPCGAADVNIDGSSAATSTRMSTRSSNGPDNRPRYRRRTPAGHVQSTSRDAAQGHGFAATIN